MTRKKERSNDKAKAVKERKKKKKKKENERGKELQGIRRPVEILIVSQRFPASVCCINIV